MYRPRIGAYITTSAHRLAVVPLQVYRRVTRHLASGESCALSEVLGILWVQIKTRVDGKEKRANIRASNSRLTVDLGSQPSSVHLHLSCFFAVAGLAHQTRSRTRAHHVYYVQKNTQEQSSSATQTRTKVVTNIYKFSQIHIVQPGSSGNIMGTHKDTSQLEEQESEQPCFQLAPYR